MALIEIPEFGNLGSRIGPPENPPFGPPQFPSVSPEQLEQQPASDQFQGIDPQVLQQLMSQLQPQQEPLTEEESEELEKIKLKNAFKAISDKELMKELRIIIQERTAEADKKADELLGGGKIPGKQR